VVKGASTNYDPDPGFRVWITIQIREFSPPLLSGGMDYCGVLSCCYIFMPVCVRDPWLKVKFKNYYYYYFLNTLGSKDPEG